MDLAARTSCSLSFEVAYGSEHRPRTLGGWILLLVAYGLYSPIAVWFLTASPSVVHRPRES